MSACCLTPSFRSNRHLLALCIGLCACLYLAAGRRVIPKRRVQIARVDHPLNESERGQLCLGPGAKFLKVKGAQSTIAKKPPHSVLSKRLPADLIDG